MRLIADRLVCRRGGRLVFANLSFALAGGEALAITGRNGAGKSSLLRLIAGLIRPEAGTVGLEAGDLDRSIGEQAHYLGHLDALKPSLSVRENLRFWCAYLGGAVSAVDAGLAAVGLEDLDHLPAAYLSAGQKRRLSLARLVAVKRPIWLLDEPTAALDVPSQNRLTEIMRGHLAGGGLVLAATHGPIGLDSVRELTLGQPS
jgi:heme exporter protein A